MAFHYGCGSSTAPPLPAERFAQFREYSPDLEGSARLKGGLKLFLAGDISHGEGEALQPLEKGSVLLFGGAGLFWLCRHHALGLARTAVHSISIHDLSFILLSAARIAERLFL